MDEEVIELIESWKNSEQFYFEDGSIDYERVAEEIERLEGYRS
jgi:hypothetical protein